MNPPLEKLKVDLSGLPESDRADLAYFLLQTLEPVEDCVADAWREEVSSRILELRSGEVTGEPIEQVLLRMRANYP